MSFGGMMPAAGGATGVDPVWTADMGLLEKMGA
jgi:hypothetical protein